MKEQVDVILLDFTKGFDKMSYLFTFYINSYGMAQIELREIYFARNSNIDGGLKIINIGAFMTALKTTWIRRLITDNNKWIKIISLYIDSEKLYSCGQEYCTNEIKNIHNKFWQDVLKSHIEVITKNEPTGHTAFLSSAIYYNENIKITNKSFFFPNCFKSGIKFINDVTKKDGKLMTYQEASDCLDIKLKYLQYLSKCNEIKDWQKKLKLTNIKEKMLDPVLPYHLKVYLKSRKGTKDMYTILNQSSEEATGKKTWNKTYNFDDKSWGKYFYGHFPL